VGVRTGDGGRKGKWEISGKSLTGCIEPGGRHNHSLPDV